MPREVKGIIGLDIDGTVTTDKNSVPTEVADYLASLSELGWHICFITGRPFAWSNRTLSGLHFPYYLAVQNGAAIVEMPGERIVSRRDLSEEILSQAEDICRKEPSGIVVYGGVEQQDRCFFCPSEFTPELLEYLKRRRDAIGESWEELPSFSELPIDRFASVKSFGALESATRIAKKMEGLLGLHAPIIHDILDPNTYVVQATHSAVSKGEALKQLTGMLAPEGAVIAAGDDFNDLSMLEIADRKVVMAKAPEKLRQLADVVASSLIEGLEKVVK